MTASGAETSLELLNAYGFAVSASRLERLLITVMLAVCLFGLWIFWNNEKWTAICKQNAWVKQIKDGIAAVLLVVQFVFMIPDIIYVLENTGFDPSWKYFLNVVNGTDLKFGRDIYFTYGPLGYLFYLMKLPENTIEYWSGIVIWGSFFYFICGCCYSCIDCIKRVRFIFGQLRRLCVAIWRDITHRPEITICCT